MGLHERIKKDLLVAIKERTTTVTDLKYIVAEFSRLKGTKDGKVYIGDELTDEQVIRVLTGIIAGEKTLLEIVKGSTSTLIPICEGYLPEKATEQEILDFISTIDFSKLKNKMQAIGITKKHFGTSADGKTINDIIQKIET